MISDYPDGTLWIRFNRMGHNSEVFIYFTFSRCSYFIAKHKHGLASLNLFPERFWKAGRGVVRVTGQY